MSVGARALRVCVSVGHTGSHGVSVQCDPAHTLNSENGFMRALGGRILSARLFGGVGPQRRRVPSVGVVSWVAAGCVAQSVFVPRCCLAPLRVGWCRGGGGFQSLKVGWGVQQRCSKAKAPFCGTCTPLRLYILGFVCWTS